VKRAIVIGLALAALIVLAVISMPGCAFLRSHIVRIDGAGPVPGDPDTIIVPPGGSIVLSPDGSWLKVLDADGNVVWEGDPNK
jgi:hypothetical protein